MEKKSTFAKMDAAGRLRLPKNIRDRLKAMPGDVFSIHENKDGSVAIRKEQHPLEILAEHAIREHRDGKTKDLDEIWREMGADKK